MDFVSKRHLIYVSQALCPPSSLPHPHVVVHHPSSENFPMSAILVMGLLLTSFLLWSYYIFVIKCCLNLNRADLVRRFSLSRRREEAFAAYSPESQPRGLEEAAIRSIPVIRYKKEGDSNFGERSLSECAVCLNEFQQGEKLRVIPNCSHAFHIDCIDVWLQNNANCPLCRRNISLAGQIHGDQLTPRPSPIDQSTHVENLVDGYEDFVVVDLGSEHDGDQNLDARQERSSVLELPTRSICPLQRKLEQGIMQKKARKLHKVTSLGDECVGIRAKDEQFLVQPIRRSFSMDSSGGRKFYMAVEQALQQQNEHVNEARSIEVCGSSGRAKRSFFSFGHGSRSRNAVLPVYFDP